ncbi:MAG: EscU/YscU/HrcU family type III secretion system export apparatus switch protein [Deltaproteobacteria bacterium]|nr:EscU/YscU/HrcU family type III secretion system export apparatus switch protein [Deltaproteobacteria bacterium]
MADTTRTEEPTPRRLREARRCGQVARSRDLTAAVSLWFALAAISLLVVPLVPRVVEGLARTLSLAGSAGEAAASREATVWMQLGLRLALPVLLAAVLAALASGVVQVGGLFTFEPLRPRLERLSPAQGVRRLFGRGWVEAVKSLAKFLVVTAAALLAARGSWAELVSAARGDAATLAQALLVALARLAVAAGALLLALGVLDLLYQRWRHRRDLRMTREELRREQREEEGDPQQRAERRRLHRELLAQRMVLDVPRATCVVVNPTHVAVALRYEEDDPDGAPVVLAKGEGDLARRIVAAARAAGIPVLRNAPVARSLLACELGAAIPERLYEAVAEVLRIVLEERDA